MLDGLFDYFSQLMIDEGADPILKEVRVDRIASNAKKDALRIYMSSPNFLKASRIKRLESEIKSHYFSGDNVRIEICMSYELPKELSAKEVFFSYKDSMWEEIFREEKILFHLLRDAEFDFDGNVLTITLYESSVARESEKQIAELFDRIFAKRCGFDITFRFKYKTEKKTNFRVDSEKKIENLVREIENNVNRERLKEKAEEKPDDEENKQKRQNGSASYRRDKGAGGGNGNGYADKKGEGGYVKRPLSLVRSSKPNVIYGRDFNDTPLAISDTNEPIGTCAVSGEVIGVEQTPIKNERVIFTFTLTDDTDTIKVKLFLTEDQAKTFEKTLTEGIFVSVKGEATFDSFDKQVVLSSVKGIMTVGDFRTHRQDTAEEKRVELHAHTKMSDMDGLCDVKRLINTAKSFGHKAVAITDHAVVQAFPDADSAAGSDIKVIYGMEAFIVDDLKPIVINEAGQDMDSSFVIFDIETTGLNSRKCKVIEIGAVKYEGGRITERFSEFVNPKQLLSANTTKLTSITDADLADAATIDVVLPKFIEFCGDSVLVAHNADFDTGCMIAQAHLLGIDWHFTHIDTIPLAKFLYPELKGYGLDAVAKRCNVTNAHHHRAVADAEATAEIFSYMRNDLRERKIFTLKELNEKGVFTDDNIRKEPHPAHCMLLAKNDLGRVNLYHLVSISHLTYLTTYEPRIPVLPKSVIEKYREGLIVGSACSEGELFQAMLLGKADGEVERVADFYDYFEIQPVHNNADLIGGDKYEVESEEDIREINRRIVRLGEKLGRIVVATGDVHMIEESDRIYRSVILSKRKPNRRRHETEKDLSLYFMTTDEMLSEFSYLGREKAFEVVVTNSNMISDMCERIHPTRPDKCPPVIENSDETLRKICYNKAHEIYGDDLPEPVTARLERELTSIISNGYAVLYIIAQKLVWKSNEDGYLVGSRGSVGSSFVATMAGITEVNPLPAHYICPKCHFTDFDSEQVKEYASRAGCDMPDRLCPKCGTPLTKEGYDIPFETFLGFKGDKEPDIDLNFSSEYQNKAHRYTEVIFGEGQTYRAGTIGTVAAKTAGGYVRGYFEERDEEHRSCEIDRIAAGCDGVRRTTGQHPGGIIVLPVGEEIDSFTPIQHPANKDFDIFTTHFDYHKIDSNLLKLDILGHDDPTMIRMLEDLTGVDPLKIPLDDKKVLSLFLNTEALGVEPEQLWHADRGTFGIPEFNTDNAMGMLRDTQPKEFSDLVRISGLAHGTDVWKGNAQDLILNGQATISTAICTRDDIMTYLISMGLDAAESFSIMEAVRKGQVAKKKVEDKWAKWKVDMAEHNVPEWYIDSCAKIQYMFPKAHAVAYVMMACRIGYFKIYYPLAYYAAFFSIRDKKGFNYEKMCNGKANLERELVEWESTYGKGKGKKEPTAAEDDMYQTMRHVHEMYARGFEFMPIDLYLSDARYFKISDGKILPPFSVIDGFGEGAAEQLAIAAQAGRFTSRDDLKSRAKLGDTLISKLDELGILGDLPQSSQLSMFDLLRAKG